MHPVLFHIGSIVIPAYGALAAFGVLLALMLAQRTARTVGIDPNKVWNLCIVSLFTALVGSRILLVIVNWTTLRSHPLWIFGLAMIHHPLVAAFGAIFGFAAAWVYARRQRLAERDIADALAAPITFGLAFEHVGALLAGSSYGSETTVRWAVIYTDPLAARWSGAPLGIPVHPVQAYAALAFLTISICLLLVLPNRRQRGDIAGFCLMSAGVAIYVTEFWRDAEGRGTLLGGALNGPQAAAIVLVLAGALLLRELKAPRPDSTTAPNNEAASSDDAPTEATHA